MVEVTRKYIERLKAQEPVRNNFSKERWERADRLAQDRAKLMQKLANKWDTKN